MVDVVGKLIRIEYADVSVGANSSKKRVSARKLFQVLIILKLYFSLSHREKSCIIVVLDASRVMEEKLVQISALNRNYCDLFVLLAPRLS